MKQKKFRKKRYLDDKIVKKVLNLRKPKQLKYIIQSQEILSTFIPGTWLKMPFPIKVL